MALPNLIAYERLLLHSVGRFRPRGPKRPLRVGLVCALEVYSAIPFWRTLLSSCGFEVVLSRPKPQDQPELVLPIPADSLCEPAKAAHRHGASLLNEDVDVVIMPWFERGNHCPVSASYGDVLAEVWRRTEASRPVPFMAPQFSVPRVTAWAKRPEDQKTLFRLLTDLCAMTPARTVMRKDAREKGERGAVGSFSPLSHEEFEEALADAMAAQEQFTSLMERETEEVLAWLEADPDRKALLFAGRPYHGDAALGSGFDRAAVEAGFAVLALSGLGPKLGRIPDELRRQSQDAYPWKQAKRFLRGAYFVLQHPRVHLACTLSFGCGFDALSVEEARLLLESGGASLAVLSVEGSSGEATAKVRLRTLAASCDSRGKGIVPCIGPERLRDAAKLAEERPSDAGGSPELRFYDRPFMPETILRATDGYPDGVCTVARLMAAQVEALAGPDAPSGTVILPAVCESCLTEGVPHLVERSCAAAPAYRWEPWISLAGHRAAKPADPGQRFRDVLPPISVGLLGNPLLVFERALNDAVADQIETAGFAVAWPDPALLAGEDVLYQEQIRKFWQQGVRHILYLMPMGCLKGPVQVHRALPRLREEYPGLQLTVVDFDLSGSSLNRANRIALALAQAQSDYTD